MSDIAGRGPAPKDPSRLAGHGAAKARLESVRVVHVEPVAQPALEEILGETNPATGSAWHPATLKLWSELDDFPATDMLRPAQWSVLARVMMLDDAMLAGELKMAAEVRLQLQKFGIAPDDVARLRIQFAQAEEAEAKPARASSRSRHAGLRLAE